MCEQVRVAGGFFFGDAVVGGLVGVWVGEKIVDLANGFGGG